MADFWEGCTAWRFIDIPGFQWFSVLPLYRWLVLALPGTPEVFYVVSKEVVKGGNFLGSPGAPGQSLATSSRVVHHGSSIPCRPECL